MTDQGRSKPLKIFVNEEVNILEAIDMIKAVQKNPIVSAQISLSFTSVDMFKYPNWIGLALNKIESKSIMHQCLTITKKKITSNGKRTDIY
jgi:hypothetical protein